MKRLVTPRTNVKLVSYIRLVIGLAAAKAAFGVIKVMRVGAGGALPGRLLFGLAPEASRTLSHGTRSVLVSGTNGKTTTTAMVRELLGGEPVVSNATGSNMNFSIAFALSFGFVRRVVKKYVSNLDQPAVFEVDEAYLVEVANDVRATHAVILNLSRDQLDRNAEVRKVASRWREGLSLLDQLTVVANCDDPLVVYASEESKNVVYFSGGSSWTLDSRSCPHCEGSIAFTSADWKCTRCGFERPDPLWAHSNGRLVYRDGQDMGKLQLGVPGDFNLGNAVSAVAVLASYKPEVLSQGLEGTLSKLAAFGGVGGRFATYRLAGDDQTRVKTYLAKNPAGWEALFKSILEDASRPSLILGLNAYLADGTDPSWIWDVDFETLAQYYNEVIVTGERCLDLAVRVGYAGICPQVEKNQFKALRKACAQDNSEVVYIGNYTAFFAMLKNLESAEGVHE